MRTTFLHVPVVDLRCFFVCLRSYQCISVGPVCRGKLGVGSQGFLEKLLRKLVLFTAQIQLTNLGVGFGFCCVVRNSRQLAVDYIFVPAYGWSAFIPQRVGIAHRHWNFYVLVLLVKQLGTFKQLNSTGRIVGSFVALEQRIHFTGTEQHIAVFAFCGRNSFICLCFSRGQIFFGQGHTRQTNIVQLVFRVSRQSFFKGRFGFNCFTRLQQEIA